LQTKVNISILADSDSDGEKSDDSISPPAADAAVDSIEIPVVNRPGEL